MRLIDADKFLADNDMGLDCCGCKHGKDNHCNFDRIFTRMDVCGMIEDAPTIDAVQVVRCKDCKHCHNYFCMKDLKDKPSDFFCAYGERKVD